MMGTGRSFCVVFVLAYNASCLNFMFSLNTLKFTNITVFKDNS